MADITDSFLFELVKAIIALAVVFYLYFKWTYQFWKRRNVPYLEPTIPFGNIQNPRCMTLNFGEQFAKLYEISKAKGYRYCGIYRFLKPILLVNDLELLKHVMTKDFDYFIDRGMYMTEKEPISAHLFALEGEKWRNVRTKLSPAFSPGKLKTMFQTLVECGNILVEHLNQQIDNNIVVNAKDISGHYTTDIIGSCAFGLECSSFTKPNSPFRKYGRRIFERTTLEGLRLTFSFDHPNLANRLGIGFMGKEMNDFFSKVVEKTVSYREKNDFRRNDFLQLLIDMKNKKLEENGHKDMQRLTMNEIIAQCFIFFAAGYETSSSTMAFSLYLLATHLDIQECVRDEIKEVLERHNGELTYDSVSEMKYLEQTIEETLRIYPPANFVGRKCVKDYKLPGEDVVIPKGTKVVISIQGIQNDPEYFPNPVVFDPDRFSEENRKKILPYSYMPFGAGPRTCIGERFGRMQVLVGLISILKNFKLTLNQRTIVPLKVCLGSVVLVPQEVWVNLERV